MKQDNDDFPESFSSQQAYFDYLLNIYLMADEKILQDFVQHSLKYENGRYYNKTDPQCKEAVLSPEEESEGEDLVSRPIFGVLPEIKTPTLLIRGACSATLGQSTAEKMLSCLSNGKMATIDMAGHALMMDNPVQTTQEITRFLLTAAGLDR